MTIQYSKIQPNQLISWSQTVENTGQERMCYATKLGFQAPAGTQFQIFVGSNKNAATITMGQSQLYELVLPENIIYGFKCLTDTSFGILDVEVPNYIQESI